MLSGLRLELTGCADEGNQGEMLADFSRLSNEEWEQFKVLNAKVLVEKEGEPTQLPCLGASPYQ